MSIGAAPRRLLPLHVLLSLFVVAGSACVPADESELGTISASLVGRAPSGTTYRLRDAVITVTGPGVTSTLVWNTEDDPSRTSLSADVRSGSYSASLADGWRLERLDATSTTTVAAELASDNPLAFEVAPDERTNVPLRFQVGTEVVDTAQGYDITVDVEEVSAREIFVADSAGSIRVFAATAEGDVAPIRTIEGPATTLLTPRGVSVFGDELVVSDEGSSSILFFPISACGDVAPTRRIRGFAVYMPTKTAIVNGELYIAWAYDGISVLPFPPIDADTPTRFLYLSTSGIGIGNAFAVDGGRLYAASERAGEIYTVPPAGSPSFPGPIGTFSPGILWTDIAVDDDEIFAAGFRRIDVFPRTGGDGTPLRSITSSQIPFDPFAIAIAGGSLYIANNQDVRVFRADANGDVAPLRTISGPRTGFVQPWGIAVR